MVDDGIYYFSSYRTERDVMSWENILKETNRNKWGERMDKSKVDSLRKTYNWYMDTRAGRKSEAGHVHNSNLLFILSGHIMQIFSEGDREYVLAKAIWDKTFEMERADNELYDFLKENHQERFE